MPRKKKEILVTPTEQKSENHALKFATTTNSEIIRVGASESVFRSPVSIDSQMSREPKYTFKIDASNTTTAWKRLYQVLRFIFTGKLEI